MTDAAVAMCWKYHGADSSPIGRRVHTGCLRYFFLLLFSVCAAAQVSQRYEFQPVHIVAGGYIPGIVAHPTEPGLIYARTDIGSVYRWDSAANRWIPLTDFNSPANYNLNGPESIALDPADPDRLYIAAGMYTYSGAPYAMLVSTDRGATFTVNPAPFSMAANGDGRSAGERLAVNPFASNELMMGTRRQGLWVSEDYAKTWSGVAGFPLQNSTDGYGVQWVVFDPKHSGVIYAGAYTTATIYRSKDGGGTWTPLPGEPTAWPFSVTAGTKPPAPQRAVINPDGNLYVAFNDVPGPNGIGYGIVEKFNPDTDAWTNITPPYDTADGQKAPRGGFAGLSEDLTRPGTVAVSTLDRWYPIDTVYLTRDGGAHWTDVAQVSGKAGVNGPPFGNFYHNPSVFAQISPWLTFGNSSANATAKFGWWMSALLIDPTNPDHLLYGTGATIFATNNLSALDSGVAPTWFVQAAGIEETAVTALISPREGANLLSGVGDIGGFRHDGFGVSPAAGMYTNPVATTVGSLDWAGRNPSFVVRTQSPATVSLSPCSYGAYSMNGGTSWMAPGICPPGVNSGNGGVLAVDAGGSTLMWSPATGPLNRPVYSMDLGASWLGTTGLPARITVVSDKVTPATFYAFYNTNGSGGGFYSTSNNQTFSLVNAAPLPTATGCNTAVCGIPVVNPDSAGDLWLALGNNGLYHSADGGVNWMRIPNVSAAVSVAVGAAAPRRANQAVYLYGTVQPLGVSAIYRSDDNGVTWVRINDDSHRYGGPTLIQADPRVYGRVYLGMNGRGIVYGDIAPAAPGVHLR